MYPGGSVETLELLYLKPHRATRINPVDYSLGLVCVHYLWIFLLEMTGRDMQGGLYLLSENTLVDIPDHLYVLNKLFYPESMY